MQTKALNLPVMNELLNIGAVTRARREVLFSLRVLPRVLVLLGLFLIPNGLALGQTQQGQTQYASQIGEAAKTSRLEERSRNDSSERRESADRLMPFYSYTVPALRERISLHLEKATVEEALRRIGAEANLKLSYGSEAVAGDKSITLRLEEVTARQALQKVARDTNLKFILSRSGQVVVTREKRGARLEMSRVEPAERVATSPLHPRVGIISGTVTSDATGEPLPGVNVVIEGTKQGTATNASGEYSITGVEAGTYTVRASFIGYGDEVEQGVEVADGKTTTVDFVMQQSAEGLDEVVVVGYGQERAATLTGSISRTDAAELESDPSVSVSNSLAGVLPGLTAINQTGQPGQNVADILVRGRSTTGDDSPLVIVDGVPDQTGAWKRIPSNDIEQISVLKDASAAIYGARAANGVILITTKRGSEGEPTFNYSFNQGVVQPTRLPEMANSWEWAEYVNNYLTQIQNDDPMFTEEEIQIMREGSDPVDYPNADWPSTIFKDYALQSKHNLSLRGGSEAVRYSLSGTYSGENSLAENGAHDYDGYTLRSNVDVRVTDNLELSLDLNTGMHDVNEPEYDGFGYDTSPLIPPYYPNGYPSSPPSDAGTNAALNITGVGGYLREQTRRFGIKGAFDLSVPQVEGLSIDGFYSLDNETIETKNWRETWTVYNRDAEADEYIPREGGWTDNPDLEQGTAENQNYLVNLRVSYDRTFGDHSLETFIAAEQSESYYESLTGYRRNFVSPEIEQLNVGSGQNMEANGTRAETARQNVFGRVSYNFQDKYLIDANFRYDGSYAFPEENRWGFFPGVSVAWRLSEEDFMDDIDGVANLKLRGSYGKMGNDQIDPFQFLALNELNPVGTHFGGGVQPVMIPGVAPNPNITWEVETTQNIGLDGTFWRGLLGFSVDVFREKRDNILTSRSVAVPIYTGLTLPDENIGSVRNRGIELQLSHRNSMPDVDDLRYSVSGNVSYVKSEVLNLSEPEDRPEYQKMAGHPLGAGLYYRTDGIFRTQEEVDSNPSLPGAGPGDLKYVDVDGDGLISDADRVRMDRSNIPAVTFGLHTGVSYKGLSLNARLAGQAEAWTYIFENCRTSQNCLRDVIQGAYMPGDMNSRYPIVPTTSEPGEGDINAEPSTFWQRNASFVRLENLQLAYALPESLVSSVGLGLSSMRVYVNGSNLFTLAHIKNYDPEGSAANTQAGLGVQYTTGGFYPQVRIFNLGVDITF